MFRMIRGNVERVVATEFEVERLKAQGFAVIKDNPVEDIPSEPKKAAKKEKVADSNE